MPLILLIEDDEPLRKALRLALGKSGYEVIEAGDGKAGLAAFSNRPADLVVTDLIMPEMDGMETIRALRKHSQAVPIIAITGGGRGTTQDYLHIAKQFGATEVFAKPFEIETLEAAVARLLGAESV